MAELADAADSKSAGTWYLGGSIPPPGTIDFPESHSITRSFLRKAHSGFRQSALAFASLRLTPPNRLKFDSPSRHHRIVEPHSLMRSFVRSAHSGFRQSAPAFAPLRLTPPNRFKFDSPSRHHRIVEPHSLTRSLVREAHSGTSLPSVSAAMLFELIEPDPAPKRVDNVHRARSVELIVKTGAEILVVLCGDLAMKFFQARHLHEDARSGEPSPWCSLRWNRSDPREIWR